MHEIHSYRMYRMEEWGHSSWRWWVSGWSQNCTWFCASCTWSRDTATVDWQGTLMSLDLTAAVLSAIKSAYQYWPLGPTWHTGRCMWTGAISEIEIKGVFAAAFTTRMASHWHWPMGTGDLWDQSVHSFCMSISDDRGLVNLCTNLSFWLMVITSSIRLRLDRRLSSLFLTSTCRRGAFTHCAPCGRPEGILQQDITSSMAFFKGCIGGQPSLGHSCKLILCLIQCLESCQRLSGADWGAWAFASIVAVYPHVGSAQPLDCCP